MASSKAIDVLLKRLEELGGKELKVGFFESSKYEDGTSVAQVAFWNEYGTKTAPPRPFMRPAVIKDSKEWAQISANGARAVLNGDATGEEVLEDLGLQVQSSIQESITRVMSPPLSPVTIELRAMKKRGIAITGAKVGEAFRKVHSTSYVQPAGVSTKPLVDSGYMFDSVQYQVSKQ